MDLVLLTNSFSPFILSFFSELSSDMILVLKIFVLMTIISYITSHLGKSPLAIILIIGISWFIIFDYFWFFGGVYVLYVLVTFGVSAVLIDFFFVSAQQGAPPEAEKIEGGISHGIDFAARQQAYTNARNSITRMFRR